MELVITILLAGYLIIGSVYALWIFLFGYDRWYYFPINCIFGVPTLIIVAYFVTTGKKNPFGKY